MNDDIEQQVDRLLRQAGPVLKRLEEDKTVAPARVHEAVGKVLNQVFPVLKQLTAKEMREVMLELLKTRPMDASDLIDLIHKNNVRLKDATGEAELFGLLRELENARLIKAESKGDEETFKLTELGRTENQQVSGKAVELGCWLLTRAPA